MIATYLTTKDVAGLLGKSLPWARAWMQEHGGFIVGREHRIHPEVFASELHTFAPGEQRAPGGAVPAAATSAPHTEVVMTAPVRSLPADWLARPVETLLEVEVEQGVERTRRSVDTSAMTGRNDSHG